MTLYSQTLTDFLIKNTRTCLTDKPDSNEFRAVFSSYPAEIVKEVGTKFEEFLLDKPQKIKFIFKVGYGLWTHWQKGGTNQEKAILLGLEERGWIDKEDKLTHYRNLKLEEFPEYDKLIIILIGIDQARDNASLDDFFRVDARTIWEKSLQHSFSPWINAVFEKYSIFAEEEQIDEVDSLLQQLYENGAGDLLAIVTYLEQLDLSSAQDGKEALLLMYDNLDSWDLPKLQELPNSSRKLWPNYVKDAATFFSYQNYLKNTARNKVFKQIKQLEGKIANGVDEISFSSEEFSDVEEFLSTLKSYIASNDSVAREKLLKTDFAPIRDKILNIRGPKRGSRPPKLTKIDAPPLEAILTALWYCLIDFKKQCTKDNFIPANFLQKINIQGWKYRHDFDGEDEGRELLQGCLGGLGAYIEQQVKIELDLDGDEINIPVNCKLLNPEIGDLRFERAGAGIPGFQFKIFFLTDSECSVERLFQWQLPENQPSRNLWNMVREIRKLLPAAGACLPVFTLSYYNELFLASDEEEANRILKLGQNGLEVINLLGADGLNPEDLLQGDINDLSHQFGVFLRAFEEGGFYKALGTPWSNFSKKYKTIMSSFTKKGGVGHDNQFAPLMYKAFAIISEESLMSPHVEFLSNAVLTGIHPALLEMITNRETFLIHGFLSKMNDILVDNSGLKVNLQQWHDVCDLAKITYPLFGLISNASKSLNTNIQSHSSIHCLGEPPQSSAPLSAKMLLRADENEEDEISDTLLFRENRESRVVQRFLEEYVMIYPHATDGISLAVINPEDFQPIIAGINAFLKDQVEKNITPDADLPYHFSFTLFTTDSQQQEATRHLQEWKKRWELARETKKFSFYQNCRLSIAHRVSRNMDDYMRLISRDDFDTDIAILMNFITSGDVGNDVEQAKPFCVDLDYPLKFPVVETPRCSVELPAQKYVRAKVISNRRFRIATLHSELGVYFKHHDYPQGQEYIVISKGDYESWRGLIEKLHKRATWVVCLDPAIDEKLTQNQAADGSSSREIIGFSSGVGFRGELNYTLSTERSSLKDVRKEVAKQLNRICGPWDNESLDIAAKILVLKSRALSGLSLVRATGPGEKNIRDLISSTLVRLTLPVPKEKGLLLCDELISLDSFIHWFDTSADPQRPDLLRVVAYLREDGYVLIDAHIIECKLAQENSDHLNKAHIQIESGLRHLMNVFCPREENTVNKFDQRYWWAQIQRLVASKSSVPAKKQSLVTHALEQLGEGTYTICWQAMVVAYWTDKNEDVYELIQQWDFFFRDRQVSIDVICAGVGIIAHICKGDESVKLPCTDETLCFPKDQDVKKTCTPDIEEDIDNDEPDTDESVVADSVEDTDVFSEVDKDEEKQEQDDSVSSEQSNENEADVSKTEPIPSTEEQEPASPASNKIPARIFLGTTIGNIQRDVYWEFGHDKLPNRHILIFGRSGVGKTYAIQSILMEFAHQQQHSAIVDYTSGFLKSQLESEFNDIVHPKGHIVKRTPLPINPFRRQRMIIEDFEDIEDSYSVAGRVTSVFTSVYSSFGDQQKPILHKVIEQGIDNFGDNYDFGKLLEDLENDGSANATAVANKLTPLGRANLFQGADNDSWQAIYTDPSSMVNVLQLAGLSRDLSKMATEFILWDLYDYASNQGSKDRPLPMVLDEIQNLDHRSDSPLDKFIREGRKFGLSAILATQTLSNLSNEAQDRLFNASHKLFFRPADTELKEYAKILSDATSDSVNVWKEKLVFLNKGECYSLGPSFNPNTGKLEEKAFPIQITAMPERLVRWTD